MSLPMRSVMPKSSSRRADGSWASSLWKGCTASVSRLLQGGKNLNREENGQINKEEDTDVTTRAVEVVLKDVALPVQEDFDILQK